MKKKKNVYALKKQKRIEEKKHVVEKDHHLMEQIQPEGGISFRDERYISVGNGYEACIHVFQYPEKMDMHWLGYILNNRNTISVLDVSTEDIVQVKRNINKSINEQAKRKHDASSYEDASAADKQLQELKRLHEEITSMGEVIKILQARIFVFAHTKEELEERCRSLLVNLEGNNYKAAIFLNEAKNEWMSMYQSYEEQQKEEFAVYGQPITSESLAGGYPFHFSSLEDDYGTLLGYTSVGGVVLFDLFYKSKTRTSYNAIVTGNMGFGKSSLLKKIMEDRIIRGDYLRTFDISGEFRPLTERYGGVFLPMDGSEGIINILQILKAAEDEASNYTLHISKLNTWYRFLMPSADEYELIELEEQARQTYIRFGILEDNGEIGNKRITGLKPDQYPILSDLLFTIEQNIQQLATVTKNKVIEEAKLRRLDRLQMSVSNLINNYGQMFNGHTSIINIQEEQIITFDMSVIKGMKDSVFNAQIFNFISMCWDNAVSNGMVMKEKYEKDNQLDDVIHYLMLIDESHRWINAKKLQALEMITTYCREGRKYFAGLIFASQSILDYVPEGSNQVGVDQLKTLFSLTQYKFIFRQDTAVKETIKKLFESQFTESEIDKIPSLEQGENIMLVEPGTALEFKVQLSPEEIRLYSGGA